MSRLRLYTSNGQRLSLNNRPAGGALPLGLEMLGHDNGSLLGSSASSSLAMDLNGYDQAIQDLTESLNEVKITAALALQESQLVREQMQQGILSVLSELTTMWCQDLCPQQQQQQPQQQQQQQSQSGPLMQAAPPSEFADSPADDSLTAGILSPTGGSGSSVEDQRTNFRYKTQLCKNFMAGGLGRCVKGDTCQYAHGHRELRRICEHPRYKTKMCSLQSSLGVCPHGASCFFAHHPNELRAKEF
ncbi:hypothetical protein BOX15_Mlig006288g2 [Macrostomum lignano]|uniref:C3H1-type domain-containing protein n=1 Tax=Macrostomum lignano TaxID=282301 RepID=A0A267E6N2_9PLAT|nr:hypothetical protein BOX15_Mlig006288g2 [Macrostomum lignano]